MLNQGVAKQILEIVRAHPGCGLDELTSLLPDSVGLRYLWRSIG
jgi:hypothetical protein